MLEELQELQELTALTQQYLKENYNGQEWKYSAPENKDYFQTYSKPNDPKDKEIAPPVKQNPLVKKIVPKAPPRTVKKQPSDIKSFNLEQPLSQKDNSDNMQDTYSKLFPNYKPVEPPQSSTLKRNKKITPVVLISFSKNHDDICFWDKVVKAISEKIKPAQILSASHIEHLWGWDNFINTPGLKYIIISKMDRPKTPSLNNIIKDIYIIETSNAVQYINDRQLKVDLWKELQQKIK